jgi:hypothetical protein
MIDILPKAIPIDMMQLKRLQGSLQLTPSVTTTPESGNAESNDATKTALLNIKEILKESGKQQILVTDKDKFPDTDSYSELTIQHSGIKLVQANSSNKVETTYSFETSELKVGGLPGNSGEDLDKFARSIKKIATLINENKVDVIGKDNA